jgi:hypothetical protein
LDRVLVEPRDGGQPPGDGGACAAPGLQVTGEGLDVGAADGEQGNGAGPAPGGELAQVECVGLAGQAAVSGQESGEGESLGVGEGGLDRGERSRWAAVVIGYLPDELRPGKLGQQWAPAIKRKPTVSSALRSRQATVRWSRSRDRSPERCSRSPTRSGWQASRLCGSRRTDHPAIGVVAGGRKWSRWLARRDRLPCGSAGEPVSLGWGPRDRGEPGIGRYSAAARRGRG